MTKIPPCREVLSGNSCFKQTPNSLKAITILLHLFPYLCSVRVQSKSHLGESLEVFLLISVDVRTGFYLGTLRFQPNHVLGIITGSSARQNIPLSSACAKLISVFFFFLPWINAWILMVLFLEQKTITISLKCSLTAWVLSWVHTESFPDPERSCRTWLDPGLYFVYLQF